MSYTDEGDKTLDALQEDTLSGMMWMRLRMKRLRTGYDAARGGAERVAREVDILYDFLMQGDLLDDNGREKVDTLYEHILTACNDLRLMLEDRKDAGAPRC